MPADGDGTIFIDRDGTHFRTILNFLRTDDINVHASNKAARELRRELEYYQLPCEGLDTFADYTRKEV